MDNLQMIPAMLPPEPETAPAPKKGARLWVAVVVFAFLIGLLTIFGLQLRRSQQGAVKVGEVVPSFELTTFDGQTFNSADYRGKVILLNFWASWCKPCEGEAEELEQAFQHYQLGGEVVFWGVDYVDTETEARQYLETFRVSYPNGPDLGTRISQAFRITGVPETYLIDRQGKLAYVKIGPFQSVDEIIAVVDSILGQ